MDAVTIDPDVIVGAAIGLALAFVWAASTSREARLRQLAALRRAIR